MKKVSILEEDRLVCPLIIDCGYIGENKFEKLEFVIPKEYKKYNKKLNFRLKDGTDVTRLFDEGTDNIFTITSDLAAYDVLSCCVVFFSIENDDEIVGKSSIFKIKFDKTIPDEDISDYEPKVVILDGLISSVKELEKTVTENEKRREEYIDDLKQRVDNGEFNGKDALINGVNTLNIVEGENISLEQTDSTLKISGTYKYDDTNIKKSIQENKTNIDTNTQDINNLKQKSDDNKNSIDDINENLKNYSLITETGNKIDLTVNSSTYVMTLDLKDKNDNVLSTGSVDLPIESMIINVTYDSEKKELKFTLQNGNVIEVPLNDLISGLITDESLENTLKNYALIKDVPTKVSQLENDLDYVKNTDYATSTVAGVVKTNAGLDVDENGMVVANTYNYDEYDSKADNTFISKGTLENVITGKNLETANNKVTSVGTGSTDIEYPSAKCTYKIKEDVDNLKSDILEIGEVSDSFIHVEDSIKNELLKLEVDGVCEQKTTTGKNLYDLTGDVIGHKLPQTLPAGTYTFSVDKKNVTSLGVRLSKTTDTSIDSVLANLYKTTLDEQRVYLTLETTFEVNYINISSNGGVTFPMLEIGATATSYEPYTGGQPSPSPDYPQEIKTITDSLSVTSCGKNIFNNTTKYPKLSRGVTVTFENQTYILNGTVSGNYVNITETINISIPLGTYKISVDSPKNFYINLKLTYEDGRSENITILKNGFYEVFTITKKIKFIYIFISGLTDGQELNDVQFKFQLMKNSSDSDSSVEDYIQSQITANLPEGEFIGKIDDTYKDTLKVEYNEEDGQYHLVLNKMIGKVVLDGSEEWNILNLTFYSIIKWGKPKSMCTHFTNNGSNWVSNNEKLRGKYTTTNIDNQFKCMPLSDMTLVDFKTWLSENNVTIYYILETPYTVDLGVVDMPLSYDEITNVFTNSDLLPQINAKYYKNFISTIRDLQINNNTLKNELASIENRLTALENASASSGSSSSEVSNEPIEESGTTSDIQEQ